MYLRIWASEEDEEADGRGGGGGGGGGVVEAVEQRRRTVVVDVGFWRRNRRGRLRWKPRNILDQNPTPMDQIEQSLFFLSIIIIVGLGVVLVGREGLNHRGLRRKMDQ